MCTVYDFPVKKLPKEVELRLEALAKDYIDLVEEYIGDVLDDCSSVDEENAYVELLLNTYTEKLFEVIFDE